MVGALLLLAFACDPGVPVGDSPAPDSGDTSAGTADTGDTTPDSGETGDSTATPVDADADGYTDLGGDCDDTDERIHPGAADGCDAIDQDCDGEAVPDGSCSTPTWWTKYTIGGSDTFGSSGGVASGDVNGDGYDDVYLWGADSTVDPAVNVAAFVLGSPDASGTHSADEYVRIRTEEGVMSIYTLAHGSDADGDGAADLWLYGFWSPNALVFVSGGGLPEEPGTYGATSVATAIWEHADAEDYVNGSAHGDFTGDGLEDFLAGTRDGAQLLTAEDPLPRGGGPFPGAARRTQPPEDSIDSENVALGDLDGDGTDELLVFPGYLIEGEDLAAGGDAAWDDIAHIVAFEASEEYETVRIDPLASAAGGVDIDGDGLVEASVAFVLAAPGNTRGVSFIGGGIPDGTLENWERARIEPDTRNDLISAHAWIPGNTAHPDELFVDWKPTNDLHDMVSCVVPASYFSGGGVYAFRTPELSPAWCLGEETLLGSTGVLDFNGDGQPDFWDRAWLMEGIDIPWEDPAKW